MDTTTRIVAFIFLWILGQAAAAQSINPKPAAKHCGSGFTEDLVPDTLFGCKMAKACEAHDACYGKCNPGQPMASSDYCKKSEFSLIRIKAKVACDTTLKADIDKANNGKPECSALGSIYMAAVGIAGQGPFNGRRVDRAGLQALVETGGSPENAAAIFRHMATRSQKGEVDLSSIRSKDELLTFSTSKQASEIPKKTQLYLKDEEQLKNEGQLKKLQELMKKK